LDLSPPFSAELEAEFGKCGLPLSVDDLDATPTDG
jgi:hypothetical protein